MGGAEAQEDGAVGLRRRESETLEVDLLEIGLAGGSREWGPKLLGLALQSWEA